MTATTMSRPKNVRMSPPLAEFALPGPACCWTWSSGRLTGFFSRSEVAATADWTCHMRVVAATPPARRNRFMEDLRPPWRKEEAVADPGIGVWPWGFRVVSADDCERGQPSQGQPSQELELTRNASCGG